MQLGNLKPSVRLSSLLLCVLSLAACETPSKQPPRPDVGAVVDAPRAKRPAPPSLVLETLPAPKGYFLQDFLPSSPNDFPARKP